MNNFSKFNIFGFLFLKLVNLQNLLMNFNTDELLHSNISTPNSQQGDTAAGSHTVDEV